MTVPYTFGTATAPIPLSQLDTNFATGITLGNTAVYLGNTTTTLGNLTLTNATISSGNVTISNISVTTANVTTANVGTLTLTNPLATTSGGTGLTSFTANQVFYASSTSAIAQSANLTFNGTTLTTANDASISGLTVGKGAGNVYTNTAVGASALATNTTGAWNTTLGYQSGYTSNNTGVTAIGYQALKVSVADYNTAVGVNAGAATTSGTVDAFGAGALAANTTGAANAGFGRGALLLNTTGSYNTAVGREALQSNTTASNNTAVGYQAGYSNTIGTAVTYVGRMAGRDTTGDANTYIGFNAGIVSTSSTNNTFVGSNSGDAVTTGSKNTILGRYNGNQGGLDIRTADNYIVLSDGDGNPRIYYDPDGTANPSISSGKAFVRTWLGNAGTYAVSSTVDFANMSGIIIVNNWGIGGIGIFLVGGGGVTLVSSVSSGYGTISFTGSVYRWTAPNSGPYTYSFAAIETRPAV